MLQADYYRQVDSGSGYVIGEISKPHPDLTYLETGTIVTLFDGVDTALDFITSKLPGPKHGNSSVDRGRGDFNAFPDYDTAMSTFRNHPEKVVKFDPAELRIRDDNEAGSQVDYDVTGDYIDIGRFMEGIPEVMGTMHNGNARNRRVNMMVNLNQWHGMSHDVITHRGERILRLVDALEAGGIRTRLTGIESSQCNHTEIVIKQHQEPLSIQDLAVVTHPEFLRRAIFRIIEHSKTFSWGYGSAVKFGQCLKPEIVESENNEEMDIIIDSNINSKQSVDSLFDQLEKLLVWEMSKPLPEVSSVKVDESGVYFNANGARAEADIQREGQEVINGD